MASSRGSRIAAAGQLTAPEAVFAPVRSYTAFEETVDRLGNAISLVVQVSRMSDGSRKIVSISEITGMEENVISMQEIFTFNRKGVAPDGRVVGYSNPPVSVPSSLRSCVSRVSSFRRAPSKPKLKLTEQTEG